MGNTMLEYQLAANTTNFASSDPAKQSSGSTAPHASTASVTPEAVGLTILVLMVLVYVMTLFDRWRDR